MVDSPFKEDQKNIIFSREALISAERRSENLGKMGDNRDTYCYANWSDQFRKRISASTPWYQNLCDASIFLHDTPDFRRKMKKLNFQAKI